MKLNSLLLLVILASFSASLGFAKSKAETRDITGCLSKHRIPAQSKRWGRMGSEEQYRGPRRPCGPYRDRDRGGVERRCANVKEDAKDAAKDSGMTKSNKDIIIESHGREDGKRFLQQ